MSKSALWLKLEPVALPPPGYLHPFQVGVAVAVSSHGRLCDIRYPAAVNGAEVTLTDGGVFIVESYDPPTARYDRQRSPHRYTDNARIEPATEADKLAVERMREEAYVVAALAKVASLGITLIDGAGFRHLADNEVAQIAAALRVVVSFQPMIRDRQRRYGGVRRVKPAPSQCP